MPFCRIVYCACETGSFAARLRPFRVAVWAESQGEMGCFASGLLSACCAVVAICHFGRPYLVAMIAKACMGRWLRLGCGLALMRVYANFAMQGSASSKPSIPECHTTPSNAAHRLGLSKFALFEDGFAGWLSGLDGGRINVCGREDGLFLMLADANKWRLFSLFQ